MKAIAVDGETGIGAAATVGRRDRVTESADNRFNKGVDIICQGGLAGRWCQWSWFEATKELSTPILNQFG